MFLFRRNVHDIAHTDNFLARFRSDDTFARGDKQHLIAAMGVHFVSGTSAEVDDGKIKVVATLRRQQRLSRHGTAREQGTIRWFRRNRVGFEYFHFYILLRVSISLCSSASGCSSRTKRPERLELMISPLFSSSISCDIKNFQPDVKAASKLT
jgi:hypothetical protein